MCYPGKPVLYFCNRIIIFLRYLNGPHTHYACSRSVHQWFFVVDSLAKLVSRTFLIHPFTCYRMQYHDCNYEAFTSLYRVLKTFHYIGHILER